MTSASPSTKQLGEQNVLTPDEDRVLTIHPFILCLSLPPGLAQLTMS